MVLQLFVLLIFPLQEPPMPCDPKLMPTFPHHRNNSSSSAQAASLAPPPPQMYTMNFGALAPSLTADLLQSSRK